MKRKWKGEVSIEESEGESVGERRSKSVGVERLVSRKRERVSE